MVCLKMPPISCKTKITDGVQSLLCMMDIIYNQASLFQSFYLFLCRYGFMRIFYSHKIKMSRWVR